MPEQNFRSETFPSVYLLSKQLRQEAGIIPRYVDCCIHGCRAFTGPYADDTHCHCGVARYDSKVSQDYLVLGCVLRVVLKQGKAKRRFMYLSPAYRLKSTYANKTLCNEFKYRHNRTITPGVYQDIFDGSHFKELLTKHIVWGGERFHQKYFSCDTDVALGAMTDGVPCFKRNGLDCWPLILTIYSVRPELRQRKEYKISCGVIPGEPIVGEAS